MVTDEDNTKIVEYDFAPWEHLSSRIDGQVICREGYLQLIYHDTVVFPNFQGTVLSLVDVNLLFLAMCLT